MALGALALVGVSSCQGLQEPAGSEMDNVLKGPHMVNIEGTILGDEETKGLALVALPDWRNTPEEHVHIFENAVEGSDASYTISPNNNRIAYFSATFGDEESVPIIAPITKAGGAYAYTAVIAPRDENGFYVIPDVQKPDTKISLIDPEADFLIGCEQSLSAPISASDKLSMDFKRPVTLFRLAIVNIDKSEAIKSISLTTDTPITGKFTYGDVNFSSGTVDFDTTEGSKTVTLEYEDFNPSTITYAYFVIIPGKTTLKSVAVKTATYTYTKPLDASQTFNLTTFKSLALDMSVGVQKTKNSGTGEPGSGSDVEDGDLEDTKTPQTLSFGDVTEFTHTLGEEDFTEPTLTGAETTVTYSVECTPEGVATIDTETGKLSFGGTAGQAVVTASAESDDTYKAGSAFYTVTVLPAPVDQPLKWMLNGQEVITTLNAKVGVAFTSPTLEGAVGNVDFTSNNGSVATVSTSGIVSIVGVGNVTITATAAAASGYKETSKSYDIVVAPADPVSQPVTYYKASVVEPGYEYIIVSEGKALANKASVVAAEDVTVDNSTITLTDASSMLWMVVAETNSDLLKYGKYHLTNDDKYLSRISGNKSTSNLEIHAVEDAAISGNNMKYTMWDNDASKFWNISIYSGGNSTYYAYLSSGEWVIKTTEPSVAVAFFNARQPQTLSFTNADGASIDLGSADKTFKATLEGVKSTVTYSSSDETVATVASDGTVTGKKKGTVTITATAASSADYQGATASYDLTVTNGAEKYYVKVTGNTIPQGTYLVVAYSSGSKKYYAFNANADSDNRLQVSPDDNDKILSDATTDAAAIVVTEGAGTNKFYLNTAKGYLYTVSDSGHGIAFDETVNEKYAHTATITNGAVTFKNKAARSNEYYLGYYASQSGSYFRYNSTSADLALYLLEGSEIASKADRNLQFASATVEKNVGDAAFTNALSGTVSDVTYASDNISVATVDAASGLVTIVGAGTATITASAPETETLKAGQASFALTVAPAAGSNKTYTKVTAFTSGKKYVIAYSGTALKNNDGSPAAYSISSSVSGNTLTLSEADAASLEWTATSSKVNTACGNFTLLNNGVYVYRNGRDNEFIFKTPSSNVDARYVWDLNSAGNGLSQKNSDQTHTYYVNYSSSWKLSEPQSGSFNNIVVYEEGEGGSTPTPPTPTTDVTYTKISSLDELNETDTYIIVNTDATKAFAGILNQDGTKFVEKDASNAVAVTNKDNVITSNDLAACEFQIKKHSTQGKFHLKFVQADKYLWLRDDKGNNFTAHDDVDYSETISVSSGQFEIKRDPYYFRYSSSGYFYGNTTSSKVLIYKKSAAN